MKFSAHEKFADCISLSLRTKGYQAIASISILLALTACGGGGGDTPPTSAPETPIVTTSPPSVTQTMPTITSTVTPAPTVVVAAASSCNLPDFQAEVMREINAARAQARMCGTESKPAVSALAWNDVLFSAAVGHSQDMAQRNFFAHTTPDGITMVQRAQNAGYVYRNLGENIAAGQRSTREAMQNWLNSPGHCLNIMNTSFTQVAVACVSTSRQQYPTYWTMMLGRPG
jgi:uncharacterized protein YkwD